MKFTDLLKEVAEDEKFLALIEKENIVIPKQPLLRGLARSSFDTFDIVRVRKNRKPLTTKGMQDGLAEAARQYFNPRIPSRRSSAFATTSEHYASSYGTVHYVFFREKANVMWWEDDTFPKYLRATPSRLDGWNDNAIIDEFRSERQFKNVIPFFDLVSEKKVAQFTDYLAKKFGPVVKELQLFQKAVDTRLQEEMKKGGIGNRPDAYALMSVNSAIFSWKLSLNKIVGYIESVIDYDPGFTSEMGDVLIEDDWIIAVNREWFDKNFVIDFGSKEIRRR